MPLGRFLKVLLGGVLALAILFVAAAEISGTLLPVKPSDYLDGYAAIEQAAWETLNAAQACAMRTVEWLKNLDHDDWLAALTGAIALFTAVLAWSTRKLWKAGEKQIALAREEFNAAHRPELIVREAVIEIVGDSEPRDVVAFVLANRGSGPCTVVESRFNYSITPPGGLALPTLGKNELGSLKFAVGEFRRCELVVPTDKLKMFDDHYFGGTIIYSDSANIRRRYVFARMCKKGSEIYLRTRNSEDEYTD